MRGHIRKHGAGWQYTIELEPDPITHKRRRKSKGGFKTKKECEAAMNELIMKLEKGEYVEYKDITLQEYMVKWLDNKKSNIKATTYEFYKNVIEGRINPVLGGIPLTKLKPLHIQEFLDYYTKDKEINSTTIKHYFTTLNTALNQAVKWQLIPSNPCAAIEPPKRKKTKMNVLTPEQVNTLLESVKNGKYSVMYIPILLAVTCGLRRGEIIALTWNNVDLVNGIITVSESAAIRVDGKNIITDTKTEAGQRSISVPPSVMPILKEHKRQQAENKLKFGPEYRDNNLVCCWPNGVELTPNYITHTFKKVLREAGLPDIRFHDLRHTNATLLLLQGVNTKVVSERLGHSSIDVTLDIYGHVLPEMQKEAAEKLDEIFSRRQNGVK